MPRFTDNLADPGVPQVAGRAPSASPGATAVAGVANLAANVGDVVQQVRGRRQNRFLNDVEAEVRDVTEQFTSEVDAPVLIGEGTEDEIVASDPTARGAIQAADRLAQSHEQGRLSRRQYLDRLSLTVKEAVAEKPHLSAAIRDRVRAVAGLNPTEELVRIQLEEDAFERKLEFDTKQTAVTAASNSGIHFFDDNGQFDSDRMALAGREILQAQALADLEADKAARAPTKEQMDVRQFQAQMALASTVYNNKISGILTQIQLVTAANPNLTSEQQNAELQQQWGVARQDFLISLNNQLNSAAANSRISPKARADALQAWQDQLNAIDELFTGDFAEAERTKRVMDAFQNNTQITFVEVAPALAQTKALFGPEVMANVLPEFITPEQRPELASDIENVFSTVDQQAQERRQIGSISALNSIADGTGTLSSMDAGTKTDVIRMATDAIDNYNRLGVDTLNDTQLQSYARLNSMLIREAQGSQDGEDIRGVAKLTLTPANTAKMRTLAASEQNKEAASRLASAQIGVGAAAMRDVGLSMGPRSKRVGSNALGTERTVTFTPVFNLGTGRLEIINDDKATRTTLAGSPARPPDDLVRDVDDWNNFADRISEISSLTDVPGFSNLNEAQLGQKLAIQSGVGGPEVIENAGPEVLGMQGLVDRQLNEAGQDDVSEVDSATVTPSSFEAGLVSPDQVNTLIQSAAKTHGVDPLLIQAVASVESNFNQQAISPAGALGVMQLMPGTASDLGVDPLNTEDNINGGAAYLAKMLEMFDGDIDLALAAYNAGPGNVRRAGNVIPQNGETPEYVRRVRRTLNALQGVDNNNGSKQE